MRKNLPYKKNKQKTNIHTNYKINPLKDIHSKYF